MDKHKPEFIQALHEIYGDKLKAVYDKNFDNQQSAVSSRQSAVSSRQSAVSSQQSAVSNQDSESDIQHPASRIQNPTSSIQLPSPKPVTDSLLTLRKARKQASSLTKGPTECSHNIMPVTGKYSMLSAIQVRFRYMPSRAEQKWFIL
jgi:hypothetical protein